MSSGSEHGLRSTQHRHNKVLLSHSALLNMETWCTLIISPLQNVYFGPQGRKTCLSNAHVDQHCCCQQQKCSLAGVCPDSRTQRPHQKYLLTLSTRSACIYYIQPHYWCCRPWTTYTEHFFAKLIKRNITKVDPLYLAKIIFLTDRCKIK